MPTSILDRIPFEQRTFPALLRRAVELFGDRPFVEAAGGSYTFREFGGAVERAAGALASLGVRRGSVVAVMLGNRLEYPVLWWAIASLGATAAVIHPESRGKYLTHMLEVAGSELMIIEAVFVTACAAELAACRRLERLVTLGDAADPAVAGAQCLAWDPLFRAARPTALVEVSPADPSTIMYTSGTTGRSKGVLRSHHYDFMYAAFSVDGQEADGSATFWSPSPMSHARTASCQVMASILIGSRVVLAQRFSVSSFWQEIAAARATHTHLSSAMLNLIARAAPVPEERTHCLKVVHCVPPPDDPLAIERRFGVRLTVQGYGMTEVYPLPQQLREQDFTLPRNCIGRPHPLMEVRVGDDVGRPVPQDGRTPGEILVRPRIPLAMLSGYYDNPEATAEVFRDAWFHTGDLATIDAEGRLYLVGRKKDYIRRRGENVSAVEVEEAALAHPAVAEAAAYGVPSSFGEEDIKLDVVLHPESGVANDVLADFVVARLPRFAWPRYVETLESMPRTPTHKIPKMQLRDRGLGPAVYDREAGRS